MILGFQRIARSGLRKRISEAAELFWQVWLRALLILAWLIKISCAPLEFAHGRGKTRSDHSQTWNNFAAASINAESELDFAVNARVQEWMRAARGQNAAASQHGDGQRRTRRRR